MSFRYSQVRRAIALVGIVVATASSAQLALAQYTWVNPTTNSALWADAVNWTGGSPGTYPNAVGATALINAPTRTGGSGNFNLTMPASDVTVGSLTVDNTNHSNNFRSNWTNGGDAFRLIFEDSDGTANYTETIGSAPGATNSQYQFLGKVRLSSDFVVNQDNYPNLNTGTTFSNLVEGGTGITMTKEGHGGIQFNYNHFPTETPFQGDVVINQGGIRLISVNPFINVSGITVNSGGQLMLADNANNNANTDWNLASGAVLNLKGAGKATDSPVTVANPEGALRFTPAQITATAFHNPVMLLEDSVISVSVATLTATIDSSVGGAGGLTKHGTGTLVLSGSNSYSGDTSLLAGGPLSITSPFLANAADIYLEAGSIFNLNFAATDVVDSLFIDGVSQAEGTWGAVGSGADNESALFTGSGLLDVTTFVPAGTPGDYNDDGKVDAADYVVWRKYENTNTELPNDPEGGTIDIDQFNTWRANFGLPAGSGGGSLATGGVPEPASWLLAAMMLGIAGLSRRHR